MRGHVDSGQWPGGAALYEEVRGSQEASEEADLPAVLQDSYSQQTGAGL